jgi:hypothetical protein
LLAPAGAPKAIVQRLEKETIAVIQSTPVKARLQVFGMDPVKTRRAIMTAGDTISTRRRTV